MRLSKTVLRSLGLGLLTLPAYSSVQALDVSVHGFLTGGMAATNAKKILVDNINGTGTGLSTFYDYVTPQYDGAVGRRLTADYDSLIGLQVDAPIANKLAFTGQLVATGQNNWDVQDAWAFGKYTFNDHWNVRAGRLRFPGFLMSEYLQVGYAYPWVRPPREVYSQIPGALSNLTGVDATFSTNLMNQDFSLTVFTGASNPTIQIAGYNTSLLTRNAYGANATFGNENFSVRIGYAAAKFSFPAPLPTPLRVLQDYIASGYSTIPTQVAGNAQALAAALAPLGAGNVTGNDVAAASAGLVAQTQALLSANGVYNNPSLANALNVNNQWGSFGGIGFKMDWKNIYALAEVTRKRLSGWLPDSYGWYGTLGYRVKDFLPTVSFNRLRNTANKLYGVLPPNYFSSNLTGNALIGSSMQVLATTRQALINDFQQSQDTWTFALRYDIMPSAALKASWEVVKPKNGTAGLFDQIPKKKSINMYSVALNVVF